MPKLYAIADLHLSYALNRDALAALTPHPEDGLILAGDVGESLAHLRMAFSTAKERFARVWWVPGNHELYTLPPHGATAADALAPPPARGHEKYLECVEVAREHGVLTPEDDFERWEDEGSGGATLVCPLFTLYDYSFRPAEVTRAGALEWAREEGIEATDEALLHNDPYVGRDEWCHTLVARSEQRLRAAAAQGLPLVLVNHWPLKERLVRLWLVPRFSIWCGTTLTEEWHRKYAAKVVVTGHLHVRRTDWIDGCRFEECSLGYPRQWQGCREKGMDINDMLREILPGPPTPPGGNADTVWRRDG